MANRWSIHAGSSGVDVDKADLQQVERQHCEFLVLQVVGSDLTAFAVKDEAVGSVPGATQGSCDKTQ
jgi:hypothetical protein